MGAWVRFEIFQQLAVWLIYPPTFELLKHITASEVCNFYYSYFMYCCFSAVRLLSKGPPCSSYSCHKAKNTTIKDWLASENDCIERVHWAKLQAKFHPAQTHFYPLKISLCGCNYIWDMFLGYVCISKGTLASAMIIQASGCLSHCCVSFHVKHLHFSAFDTNHCHWFQAPQYRMEGIP